MPTSGTDSTPTENDTVAQHDVPLAIVGMACRLPGANNLEEYWDLILHGKSAIGEIPRDRFDRGLYFDSRKGQRGKSYATLAGLLGPDEPVENFYGLTEAEIARADPFHLQMLPLVAEAFAQAGLDPVAKTARRGGVFIGHSRGSEASDLPRYFAMQKQVLPSLKQVAAFSNAIPDPDAFLAEFLKGQTKSTNDGNGEVHRLSRLISRAFGMTGPALTINAACASSLIALAAGCDALQRGEIDVAVIGGASCFKFASLVQFSQARALSPSGSRPFDSDADGFVASEGRGVVVVKRLGSAIEDGNAIQAVIGGIGISSDGRGKSLWAPREEGQLAALGRACRDPAQVGQVRYVEAHATSTPVGDATEAKALIRFFRDSNLHDSSVRIGSIKANIGHTLEVAGLAGLIKTVLAIQHKTIPPAINVNSPSSRIDWKSSPLSLSLEEKQWPDPKGNLPRAAGVNSFGIGGCNAHVVVEEFQAAVHRSRVAQSRDNEVSEEPIAIVGSDLLRFDENNASEFEYDWRRHKIPPKQIAAADPLQFMLLEAVDRAVEKWTANGRSLPTNTGVVIGAGSAAQFAAEQQLMLRLPELRTRLTQHLREAKVEPEEIRAICDEFSALLLQRFPALEDETGSYSSSTLATRISKVSDLTGGAFAVDQGDLSAIAALSLACQMLRTGRCESVVCGAGSREFSPLRAMSSKQTATIPSDGAAVVILKRLSVAQAAGDPILGTIDEIAISAKETLGTDSSVNSTRGALSGLFELIESLEARTEQHERRTLEVRDGELSGRVVFGTAGSQQKSIVNSPDADPFSQIFRFEAATRSELFQQIDTVLQGQSTQTTTDNFGTKRFRLSVVARNLAERQKQLKTPRFQQMRGSARTLYADKQLFFRDTAELRGKLAFLFPGQGSQYPEMGLDCRNASNQDREIFDELSLLLTANGAPRFEELVRDAEQLLGRDVRCTKLAMLAMNTFHLRRLSKLGIAPDLVTGHSLGEHAALIAAGCWSFEAAVRTIQSRCDILERADLNGAMLCCFETEAAVLEIIGDIDHVFVTHRNTPRQTSIGGTEQGIKLARERLRTARIVTQRLSSCHAFHSPLMEGQQAAFREALQEISLRAPTLPFLSGVSLQRESDAEAIRELLVWQLATPVDFVAQIQQLYREGVRLFLEVGPGSVLTQLVRSILGYETDFHALAVDQRESYTRENQLALQAFIEINDLETSDAAPLTVPNVTARQADNVCQRYVIRRVQSELIAINDSVKHLIGSCLILGANEVAGQLARQLQETGARVVRLSPEDPLGHLLEQIIAAWKEGPVETLILATPWDDDAVMTWDAEQWKTRQDVGVFVPYFVVQKWVSLVEEAKLKQATLFSLGRIEDESSAVESGALAGLTKAIGREFGDSIQTRVVDFSSELQPVEIAELALRELRIWPSANELIWSRESRFERQTVAEDVPSVTDRNPQIKTWIVTGGARGITAQVALGLAKQYQCHLHLIGTSPVPEIDPEWRDWDSEQKSALRQQVIQDAIERGISPPVRAWERVEQAIEIVRTLRLIREAGARVTYHSCDLSDREQVCDLLQKIRAVDGPIEGIVHGAGFERAARFRKKDPELVERTIASKVVSAFQLMSLTRDDPVKCFIAFGSISGRFGGIGQTDYCLANAQLSKLVAWYRTQRPEVKATTIAWHSWAEVGMAMRPEAQFSKQQDWEFLPVDEGIAHFLNELVAGCPEPEVTITTPAHHARMTQREKQQLALIDEVHSVRMGQFAARVTLDPVGDPFLAQHTLRGRPLLPLAVAAELLVQSVVATGEQPHRLAIRNLRATDGFKFLNEEPHSATIEATREGNHWNCRLHADLVNRSGRILKPNVERFSGRVVLTDQKSSEGKPRDLDVSQLEWKEFAYRESADSLVHGPVLQAVKKVCLEHDRLYAQIVAPAIDEIAPARNGEWVLPVAVLDACLFSAGLLHWHLYETRLGIPSGWNECIFYRKPRAGEVCLAVVELLESAADETRYQIALYSELGERLLEIAGCRVVEVPNTKRGIEIRL